MKGYRYNGLYGSQYDSFPNHIDAREVIKHEIFDLYNIDILDNLRIKFGSSLNDKFHSKIVNIINDMSFCPELLNPDDIVSEIIGMINEFYHTDIKYVMWLCDSISDIRSSYEIHSDTDLMFYEYDKSKVILSDLGRDGKLYGYECIPFTTSAIVISKERVQL